jgi:UDP-glucose 4-epimerase
MKRAIVTGGAGFIGSHVVEALLARDVETIVIDNFASGKEENVKPFTSNPKFTLAAESVTDFDAIAPLFKGVDVVFHQAASKFTVCLEDPRKDLEVNAKGTFNILEASRLAGVARIVHASTGSVYGEPESFPQRESDKTDPTSFYGTSKLAGEKYCGVFRNLYGTRAAILRYFHVYGPRQESSDYGGVIPIFIRRLFAGEHPIVFGDGSQVRSFTYVGDVVRANLFAAEREETIGRVYNCASGIKVTIRELAEKIIEAFGAQAEPEYRDWRPGDIKYFDVSNAELSALGFRFETGFDRGLRETIAWYREYFAEHPPAS